jgi:hypothetical protein
MPREGPVPRPFIAFAASLLVSVGFSFAGGSAAAQVVRPPVLLPPPVLKLPLNESPAGIARMDVRVTVSGLESETVTTITFSNPNARQLAGDLEFPLPDGAAVAGYALDIGGRMVDGVGVTKEKARVVLETEMRRRVDPGPWRRSRCLAAMPRATCRCRASSSRRWPSASKSSRAP